MLRCWSWAVLVGQVGAVGSRGRRSSRNPSRAVRSAYYVYVCRSTALLCRCTVRPRNCCWAFAFSYRNNQQPCYRFNRRRRPLRTRTADTNDPYMSHYRPLVAAAAVVVVVAAAVVLFVALACHVARALHQMARRALKQLFHHPPFSSSHRSFRAHIF